MARGVNRISLAATIFLVNFGSTQAAIRYCGGPLTVLSEDQRSEAEAHRKGIERWSKQAGSLGSQWAGWRLAIRRDVKCAATAGHGYVCRVTASPCAIAQNPSREPRVRGKELEL